MRRLRLWSSLFLLLVAAPAARAQVAGNPFEFSGQAGLFSPDARSHVKAGPAYGFSLGYRLRSWLVAEGHGIFAPSDADTTGEPAVNFSTFGVDLRFNLRPGESPVVPYLFAGMAVGRSHAQGSEPDMLERGAPSVGAGALFNLRGAPRWSLRLQVRDVFFQDRGMSELSQHFAATAGIHYLWGGRMKDVDLDGVRDWLDRCPATPIGARVDARGCPIDSDRDSVFDGIDQCEGTPAGARVDARGCPTDADGDKVWDGIDQCPTRRRARASTRAAARTIPTTTRWWTGSTSAPTRRPTARSTSAAARRTPTATGCATGATSARTRAPASRWTTRAARSS
jgi:OOP family OmpA-OmpF porin